MAGFGHFFVGMANIENFSQEEANVAARALGIDLPTNGRKNTLGPIVPEKCEPLVRGALTGSVLFTPDDDIPAETNTNIPKTSHDVRPMGNVVKRWDLGAPGVLPSGVGARGQSRRKLNHLSARDMKQGDR